MSSEDKNEEVNVQMVELKEEPPLPVDEDVKVEHKKSSGFWEKFKKKKDNEDEAKLPSATVLELFSFATPLDFILMIFGTLAAIILGCGLPLAMLVFGDVINLYLNNAATSGTVDLLSNNATTFITGAVDGVYTYYTSVGGINCSILTPLVEEHYNTSTTLICLPFSEFNDTIYPNSLFNLSLSISAINCTLLQPFISQVATCMTNEEFIQSINMFCYYFIIIAITAIILASILVSTYQIAAERQVYKIRRKYFKSVLRQDIAWFDVNPSGEVASRLVDDMDKVQTGMGEKLGITFQWLSTFVCGFTIGFVRDWRLTLMLLIIVPFLAVGGALLTIVTSRFTNREQKKYASAGALAEEVLSSVRTVISFGGEFKESERYDALLSDARNFGIKKGATVGFSLGYIFFFMFSAYAIAFWFGGFLISLGIIQGGEVLAVFFGVLIGAFALGQAAPNAEAFSSALGAAGAIFEVIKRQPPIDSDSNEGTILDENEGTSIHFKDVSFNYPARPEIQVLKSFNLDVQVGQTVALVGHSGCGKSTVVSLLQRFYDIENGEIKIGSHLIKDLNLSSLRNTIGVVSQEPVLFDTTIINNIKYGRDDATREEIESATKAANVHSFITSLPDGYETLVGERGTQLSGGQKQRIAIARALVRNPKILLLDEATSALDSESERIVQEALDKAKEGRTSIVIAHRLSTIQNSDLIVCLENGEIIETGTHNELMTQKGLYYEMVTTQTQSGVDDAFIALENNKEDVPGILPKLLRDTSRQFSRQYSRQTSGGGPPSSTDQKLDKKTKTEILKKKQEEWDKELPNVSILRIIALNAREWWAILIGILAAIVQGSVFPLFAIFFGNVLETFNRPPTEVVAAVSLPAGLFLLLALISATAMFTRSLCFAISGEYLTARIRSRVFRAILRQDLSWFDDERNSTGALTTKLAEDAALVQGATGIRLATLIETMYTLLLALGIAFGFSAIMTLVILGFAPLLIITGAIRALSYRKHLVKNKSALSEAGKLVVDSVENIRTVTSLNLQRKFSTLYEMEIRKPYKTSIGYHIAGGVGYGITQGMMFIGYAIAFRFGAFLVTTDNPALHTEFQDFVTALFAVVFGAFAIGQASAFSQDFAKAKVSANRIFAMLDREPLIDNYSTEGEEPESIEGSLSLKDVNFNYPSRPDVPVLQEFSISAPPGQTIALVGPSGCGKSTVVSLTERFYDILSGSLMLDGIDVRELNVRWLRGQIGLVSQEPVLFNISIADNIRYGANHRAVSDEEVIEAAKAANIHDFIQSLPLGYGTNVGDKGTQLSGGQKQRIAIARALVRNPKILLLDEATSALDSESERVVQEALDKAREGRTSIVIAHRLSTIYNADCIIVINNGKVIESGTHSQLLASGGLYSQLHQRQQLSID